MGPRCCTAPSPFPARMCPRAGTVTTCGVQPGIRTSSMRRYCYGSEGVIEGGTCCQNYGFTLETGRYLYRLRCNPIEGDYQAYLSCFDKQTQQMGLTEQGRQRLRNAADPTLPHRYEWYVIEYIHTPERRIDHDLPLEDYGNSGMTMGGIS